MRMRIRERDSGALFFGLRSAVESVENPMKLKIAKAPQLNAVNARDPMKHGTTNVQLD